MPLGKERKKKGMNVLRWQQLGTGKEVESD